MKNTNKLCLKSLSDVVKDAIDDIYPSNYILEPSKKYTPLTCSGVAFIEEWIQTDTDLYKAIYRDIKAEANRSDFINAKTTPKHISSKQYKKRVFDSFLSVDILSKIDSYAKSLRNVIRGNCYYYECQQRFKYSKAITYSEDIEKTLEADFRNDSLPYEDSVRRFVPILIEKAVNLAKNDSCLSMAFNSTEVDADSRSVFIELLDNNYIGEYEKLALITILALIPKDNSFDDFKEDVQKNILFPLYYKYCVNILKKVDIWNAGKHWYEQTKLDGNRFSKLFPETTLLPLAGTIPIYVHFENKSELKLMDAISGTPGHLFLIGEGGIGKTTALYNIMGNAFDNTKESIIQQVPLFIELSRAYSTKDFDLDRGASLFIRHEIQNQIQVYLKTEICFDTQIENVFTKKNNEPEYILLLDGLNEVSREKIKDHSIYLMVVAEIIYIMANYDNVKVILTSRSKENLVCESKSLFLSGIKPEQIEVFLNDKGVSIRRIKKILANTQLMSILRIPLFLTIYVELNNDEEVLSRGEILHSFFTKTNKTRYSEKERISIINNELIKATGIDRSEGSKNCITPNVLSFILDFVMPQIAWIMVKKDRFQISRPEINKAIRKVLHICGMQIIFHL